MHIFKIPSIKLVFFIMFKLKLHCVLNLNIKLSYLKPDRIGDRPLICNYNSPYILVASPKQNFFKQYPFPPYTPNIRFCDYRISIFRLISPVQLQFNFSFYRAHSVRRPNANQLRKLLHWNRLAWMVHTMRFSFSMEQLFKLC